MISSTNVHCYVHPIKIEAHSNKDDTGDFQWIDIRIIHGDAVFELSVRGRKKHEVPFAALAQAINQVAEQHFKAKETDQ